MSLYRTYRPKQFSEIEGQEHVTKTLINQIVNSKINHAYLFCGSRGTGKTSVAKIFAKAVNCQSFNDGNICGKCEYCKSINGANLDIFEIDAASNNGVDAVRELIEKVKYPPVHAKYKVYIVDEVHMFSSSAFNALLKTLEEPPAHVIFILATTEPHKLLPTVLSRCLRFDFRAASLKEIECVIKKICKKEKISINDEAVQIIAAAGNGSFRDALSLTETVASYTNGEITTKDVNEVLGAVDKKVLQALLEKIINKNAEEVIKNVEKIFSVGRNINAVVRDFLQTIKTKYIETSNKEIMKYYQIFAELSVNIKTAVDAQSMFEGACLLCTTF